MDYKEWLNQVDKNVESMIGLSINDLSDFMSRDAFEDGLSPQECAEEWIKSDDCYSLFFKTGDLNNG
jgi:hypothetical protein